MAAHSSHNDLSMHSILSVFVYSYHYFFSKQKKKKLSFVHSIIITSYQTIVCYLSC